MKLYKTVPGHQCGDMGSLEEYKANEEKQWELKYRHSGAVERLQFMGITL